jgi:hypothetical protein
MTTRWSKPVEHVREVRSEGYRIRLDLHRQVLGFDIPNESAWLEQEMPLIPAFPGHLSTDFVSAGTLAMKAKLFDDGFYAALELALQNGAGRYPGKVFLLKTLAENLAVANPPNSMEALTFIYGACELGGIHTTFPQSSNATVKLMVADFLRDELRSKPVGFYTWSSDLERIFRQDRLLQTPLRCVTAVKTLADLMNRNDRLRNTYTAYLDLMSRLTNPPTKPDLRPFLLDASENWMQRPSNDICFFPPSRAHETDLIKKLYDDRPVPDGFNLMDELIARIRSRALSLTPTEQSGWYDYQLWSIEPLVIPERMREATRILFGEYYIQHLLKLFKVIYALTRETHVKQLEPKMTCEAQRRSVVYIHPEMSVEPLATYFLRRALSYRFIHQAIVETFGTETLTKLHRVTPTGYSQVNLAAN